MWATGPTSRDFRPVTFARYILTMAGDWPNQGAAKRGSYCSTVQAVGPGGEVAAVVELMELADCLGPWAPEPPGCPSCEEISTVTAAIDIVVEGDQISLDCYGCGRIVRTFSWHEDDGLPECYLGRTDANGRTTVLVAVYGCGGAVRHVPAVDPYRSDRHFWPGRFTQAETARDILAHLVGLDVPVVLYEEFELDMIATLDLTPEGEWELLVEDITDWLAANR